MKYVYIPIYARNVVFSKDTEKFLTQLERKSPLMAVKNWIKSNLRNYLINNYPSNDIHDKPLANDPDWISNALARGDKIYNVNLNAEDKDTISKMVDFLRYYDDIEKIKKISYDQLKKMMLAEEAKKNITHKRQTGINIIVQYSNGYKWIELLEADIIKQTGFELQNCLKLPEYHYGQRVAIGMCRLFCLRDKEDNPHVVIELDKDENRISQIKGKQNKPVAKKYRQYLLDFLVKNYIHFDDISNYELIENGFIFLDTIYAVSNMPSGITVDRNVDLSDCAITQLPDDLTVNGNLILYSSSIEELPHNLQVIGKLDIRNTKIKVISLDIRAGSIVR